MRAISMAVVLNVMLKCMIWVTLADGVVADSEVELLHETLNNISENEMSKEAVKEAVESARDEVSSGELEKKIREIAPSLSNEAKKLVLQASLAVAAADGEIDASEEEVMKTILSIFSGEEEVNKTGDISEEETEEISESEKSTPTLHNTDLSTLNTNIKTKAAPVTTKQPEEASPRLAVVRQELKTSPKCVSAIGA